MMTLWWRENTESHKGHYCKYFLHNVFLFPFVQAQIKKNPAKLRVTGLFLGESTGHRWIPLTKGQ